MVHSSINQFVVFEKFAEMNNKYDVKHFSELIDTFNLAEEMKLINDDVNQEIQANRIELNQTVFDPLIDPNERQKCQYEFAEYQPRRYDVSKLPDDHPMLSEPPESVADHVDKKELINFILDKAFLQQALNQEYVQAAQKLFKSEENRELLLTFLEQDY